MIRIALIVWCVPLLIAGKAQASDKEVISVIVSPLIDVQLQKSSLDERNQFESAIKTGNKYIPYHFDGTSYAEWFNSSDKNHWLKNVRPLINRDMLKWYNSLDIEGPRELNFDGMKNGYSAGLVVVCPQIQLISASKAVANYKIGWKTWPFQENLNYSEDSFELQYRAKVIGAIDALGQPPEYFIPEKKGEFINVLISLDNNLKVSRVLNEYHPLALTPKQNINGITLFISGVWSKDVSTDDKIRLKEMIKNIKEKEMELCGEHLAYPEAP